MARWAPVGSPQSTALKCDKIILKKFKNPQTHRNPAEASWLWEKKLLSINCKWYSEQSSIKASIFKLKAYCTSRCWQGTKSCFSVLRGKARAPSDSPFIGMLKGIGQTITSTEKSEHGNDSLSSRIHQHGGWPCGHPPSTSRTRPGPANRLAAASGLKETAVTAACGPTGGHTRLERERPSQHSAKGGGEPSPTSRTAPRGRAPPPLRPR